MFWLAVVALVLWAAVGPLVPLALVALLCWPKARSWVVARSRGRTPTRRHAAQGAAIVAVALLALALLPDGVLPVPQAPGRFVTPAYVGRPATVRPLPSEPADQLGTFAWAGPVGERPEVRTAWSSTGWLASGGGGLRGLLGEHCSELMLADRGAVLALCEGSGGPVAHLVDPADARVIATHVLPTADVEGTACGSAAFVDDQQRAWVAAHPRRVRVLSTAADAEQLALVVEHDLSAWIAETDCIASIAADATGTVWWVSSDGLAGTIAPDGATPSAGGVLDLGEKVERDLTLGSDGTVVVAGERSVHSLRLGPDGVPERVWSGELPQGSRAGGPVVLLDGERLAVPLNKEATDDAERRVELLVLDRSDGARVCASSVLGDGAQVDDSVAALGSAVLVANADGRGSRFSRLLGWAPSAGIARVDVSAAGKCSLGWTNDDVVLTSAPRVTLGDGLVLGWTKRPSWWGVSAWYLTAIDARSGRHVWSVRTGTGMLSDNLGSDPVVTPGGRVVVGVRGGLVAVGDRRPSG